MDRLVDTQTDVMGRMDGQTDGWIKVWINKCLTTIKVMIINHASQLILW